MDAKGATPDARLMPIEIVALEIGFEEIPNGDDETARLLAIGVLTADAFERRVAGGDAGLAVFEDDQRGRNVDGVKITLTCIGQHRIVIRDFRRRERTRLPYGCGTPLAAADARNLH